MKGLILIYGITLFGSIAALRTPFIGLFIYVGFAVLRPQFIWGWAGDLEGISLYVGIATLIGWILTGFGSKSIGRGKSIVAALILFTGWMALPNGPDSCCEGTRQLVQQGFSLRLLLVGERGR